MCMESVCIHYITKIICVYFPRIVRMKLNSMEREFIVEDLINREESSEVKYLVLNGKLEVMSLCRLYRLN